MGICVQYVCKKQKVIRKSAAMETMILFKIHTLESLINPASTKKKKDLRSQAKISLSEAKGTPALVPRGTIRTPFAPLCGKDPGPGKLFVNEYYHLCFQKNVLEVLLNSFLGKLLTILADDYTCCFYESFSPVLNLFHDSSIKTLLTLS